MSNNHNVTIFHNSINEQGHSNNVRTASDKHNLRLNLNSVNVINNNTKNRFNYQHFLTF